MKNLVGSSISCLGRKWVWKGEEGNTILFRNIVHPKTLYKVQVDSRQIIQSITKVVSNV